MLPLSPPWRGFSFPLNVFMHILAHEEEDAAPNYLHYGLFERQDESLSVAQERSTELLASRLPVPPCRVLDVGMGLGTTTAWLRQKGYAASGISPDEHQIALARSRHAGQSYRCIAFEHLEPDQSFDVLLFQESSQYIDSDKLFEKAKLLAPRVLVLDEFALVPTEAKGALHSLQDFCEAAKRHDFSVIEEVDLSAKAAPTMEYFTHRIPAYRKRLVADLGILDEQIENLIESGAQYRQRYASGAYGYRLLDLLR